VRTGSSREGEEVGEGLGVFVESDEAVLEFGGVEVGAD